MSLDQPSDTEFIISGLEHFQRYTSRTAVVERLAEMYESDNPATIHVALVGSVPHESIAGAILHDPVRPLIVVIPAQHLDDRHLRLGCLLLFETLPAIASSTRRAFYLGDSGSVMDEAGDVVESIDLSSAVRAIGGGTTWAALLLAAPPRVVKLPEFGAVQLYRF